MHYHITSGDTGQIADKLDKGILENDPPAKKKKIRSKDLIGLPLFASEQAWYNEIKE